MASVIVTAAEGVRSLLQAQSDAGSFIRTFTAKRVYSTEIPLTDDELHVHIAHAANELELGIGVRAKVLYKVPVLVGVRKRFTDSEVESSTGLPATTEVDELVELCEQIAEFLYGEKLIDATATEGPANLITIAPENYLREHKQFFGLMKATWQQYKAA